MDKPPTFLLSILVGKEQRLISAQTPSATATITGFRTHAAVPGIPPRGPNPTCAYRKQKPNACPGFRWFTLLAGSCPGCLSRAQAMTALPFHNSWASAALGDSTSRTSN
jgi:hypothetical protein